MASEQSFRNEFLLALPSLKGSYFEDTLTLIVDHNSQGAFGLVINKPLAVSISDYFPEIGDAFSCPVLSGGPVQEDSMVFLHEPGPRFETTFPISEGVVMTTSHDFIECMRKGEAPGRTLALVGYAGWGPLQLEDEIGQNAWLLTPADPTIVFDTPFSQRLDAAARILGIDLNLISPSAGHD